MKVILKENVENLGKMGDIVSVKKGFARNYLIPRGLAIQADERNVRILEHEKRVIEQKRLKEAKDARALKDRIEAISLTFTRQSGEEERIFGSVTAKDIEEALLHEGLTVERKNILLEEPLKKLGIYNVKVRVASGIEVILKVWVTKKEG